MTLSRISIIIITRNRPQMLAQCLEHLAGLDPVPGWDMEIVVVDSSTGEETWSMLENKPEIVKHRIPDGRDNMPGARNCGIDQARGNVLAFLDDDCMASKGWLEALLAHYGDPDVGGAGGRLIDERIAPEENPNEPVGQIGENGRVYLNFSRTTDGPVDVDHLPGGNMSFRREVILKTGRFDPGFIGPNYMEETDFCVRVSKQGIRLVYEPKAFVNHLNAPREFQTARTGFERRLIYYSGRNKTYFLLKNYPPTWPRFRHEFLGTIKCQAGLFLKQPGWPSLRAVFDKSFGILAGIGAYAVRRE